MNLLFYPFDENPALNDSFSVFFFEYGSESLSFQRKAKINPLPRMTLIQLIYTDKANSALSHHPSVITTICESKDLWTAEPALSEVEWAPSPALYAPGVTDLCAPSRPLWLKGFAFLRVSAPPR